MPNPGNLVHQVATSTGTGSFTLTKVNGKNDFATAFTTGGSSVFHYFISNRDAAEWEVGLGSAPTTASLARDDVLFNSLGSTAKIDFTAGTKDVTNDIPALNQVIGSTVASSGHAAVFATTRGNELKSAGYVPQAALSSGTGINFSGATISIVLSSGTGISISGNQISATAATTAASGITELAEDTEYRNNASGNLALTPAKVWSAAGSFALSNSSANVAVDMSTFLTLATLAMATNHTLSDPSSPKVGQHFIISVNTTTSRTLTLSTAYKLWSGVEVGPYTVTTSEKLFVCGFIESSTGCRVTAVGRTTVIT